MLLLILKVVAFSCSRSDVLWFVNSHTAHMHSPSQTSETQILFFCYTCKPSCSLLLYQDICKTQHKMIPSSLYVHCMMTCHFTQNRQLWVYNELWQLWLHGVCMMTCITGHKNDYIIIIRALYLYNTFYKKKQI